MSVTPAQYARIREIFHGAWERPLGERTAFLDGACGNDAAVRARVEELLTAAGQGPEFMAKSAAHVAGLTLPGHEPGPGAMPSQVGRYRIIRLLGEGGMGSAYEAEQENPLRRVALKTIRPGLGTAAMQRRFAQEAHILGRLRHPGIALVLEAGVAEGPVGPVPFIAMELVAGVPLDVWVKQQGPSREERIELLARVCDGVQHAHGNGVVHRDLKPANIMVEDVDRRSGVEGAKSGTRGFLAVTPKILDFGVARLVGPEDSPLASLATDPGTLIGTLAYMSPEQVAGGDVDARADVYALGVLLFELLTGRLPRETDGKPIAEAARIIRDEEPLSAASLDASLRGDLDTICAKAMERDPARRYQTAAELGTDLRRHLGDEPIIARPATVMYQARKFARRHRGLVAGLAAAGVVLVLGVASTVWYAVVADRERGVALKQEAASKWTSYRLSVAMAQDRLGRDPVRAMGHLADAPAEMRGWEWVHLKARLEPDWVTVASDVGVMTSGAFGEDGRARAAVVRAGRMEVVDVESGRVVMSVGAPGVSGLAMSANGEGLAAYGGEGGVMRVFDVGTAAVRMERDAGGRILAAGMSPDGSLVVMVVEHRGLVVLATASGEARWKNDFEPATVRRGVLEISADNRRLLSSAVSSDASNWIHLYELTRDAREQGVDEAPNAVFDPTSGMIATGTLGGVRLRDAGTLEVRRVIHGEFRNATALRFTPDGTRLVGHLGRRVIHVWNAATGELERAVLAPTDTSALAVNRTGDAVLAAERGGVTLIRLADRGVRTLRGHTSYVYSVAWSGDGRLVASAGWDATVRVWDVATGGQVAVIAAQPTTPWGPVGGVAFSEDSRRVVVLTHMGECFEMEVSGFADGAGEPLRPPPSVGVDGAALAQYWAKARPGAKRVVQTGGERDCSSPDGTLLARVDGNDVVVTERAGGLERRRVRADAGTVYATAFSPDGARLVTTGSDRSIRIWDVLSGECVAELHGHESVVYTLNYSPDGSRLVSGDGDGLIFVWDTARNEKVAELRGHTSYVHSLAFSPDGSMLCSGSGDGTVRIWAGGAGTGSR